MQDDITCGLSRQEHILPMLKRFHSSREERLASQEGTSEPTHDTT
jgi:hypothetical protein